MLNGGIFVAMSIIILFSIILIPHGVLGTFTGSIQVIHDFFGSATNAPSMLISLILWLLGWFLLGFISTLVNASVKK